MKAETLICRVGKAKPQGKAVCDGLASAVTMEIAEQLNYYLKKNNRYGMKKKAIDELLKNMVERMIKEVI